MRKRIIFLMASVLLVFSFFSGRNAYLEYKPIWIAKAQNEAIKDAAGGDLETDAPYICQIDFEALRTINEDIAGWLYIPGTSIDYPILIGDTDDEYLYKDAYGEENKAGSIFSFSDTSRNLTDARTVLFGHNMKEYFMFGELKRYLDEDFRKEHKYFYVYTDKRDMKAEIFSIFVCGEDDAIFWDSAGLGSKEYEELLAELVERNEYSDVTPAAVSPDKQSFTLVTCKGSAGTSYRLVITGIMVEENGAKVGTDG